MNQMIANMVVRFVANLPMNGYGTYVVNGVAILGWLVYMGLTLNFEIGAGAIALHLGQVFTRRSNDKQSDKLLYLESLLQEVTAATAEKARSTSNDG